MATDNAKITLGVAIFDGKGENIANLKDYNMAMFKVKYSFYSYGIRKLGY